MIFEIVYRKVFKSRQSEQSNGIVEPQHEAPVTQTHDLDFDTICWIKRLIISSKNQLMSSEESQILLWHSKLHPAKYLRVIQMNRIIALLNLNTVDVFELKIAFQDEISYLPFTFQNKLYYMHIFQAAFYFFFL